MPNDFQVNFLNGLEMARSTQGAKLDAMQQAASMQYQISAKQMDFQMGLLKLREQQAAQAVEMRMAQDEHQLKLKDFALRAEQSKMNAETLSIKMEEEKISTVANSLFERYQAGMQSKGFLPNSPEEVMATDAALQHGGTFSDDPRINARVALAHSTRKTKMQEGFFASGMDYLGKIVASRQEARVDPETGETVTDKMYGLANKGELELVAQQFERGAALGHEPSKRMYAEVRGLINGVSAPATGVQPAASAAAGVEAKYGMPQVVPEYRPGMSDTDFLRGLESAQTTAGTGEVQRYTDTIQAKLAALSGRLASDPQAALGVKQLRDRVEMTRQASVARLEGKASLAAKWDPASGVINSADYLPLSELERLAKIEDPALLARELQSSMRTFRTPIQRTGGY